MAESFFLDPRDPRPKKFSGAARAGPVGPNVVQIIPLGSLTLLKRSGTLKNDGFDYKYYAENFCLAKVMPKIRFFGLRWGFLARVGGWLGPRLCSRPQNPQKSPKFENSKKIRNESFDPFFFAGFSRTLKGLD